MAENTILSLCIPCPTPMQARPVDDALNNEFQSLCNEISRNYHCQVVLDVGLNSSPAKKRLSIETHQSVYNVTISGAYQNVVSARGALIRNSPLKPKLSVKISKALISADSFQDSTTSSVTGSSDKATSSYVVTETNDPNTHSSSGNQVTSETATSSANSDSESAALQQKSNLSITTPFSCYFNVIPEFRAKVDQISSSTKTSITIASSQLHTLPSAKSVVAAHARQEMAEFLISGSWEDAEAARLLLLVAVDSLQPNIVQEKVQVELKYQNMIGGRKRQEMQDLMSKTSTNIYFCSPFVQTSNKNGSPLDSKYNYIYITGENDNVQAAKAILSKASARVQAVSSAHTRQVSIASRKLDWMQLNHRDRLRSIMIDNASFIAFPPLGASHPIIFVYGESRVNVERTIRTVMQLSSQFHSGSINILSPVRENLFAIPVNSSNALSPIANVSKLVSQSSGAEVEFRNNGFLIFGNEIQTRIAAQYLTDIDFIKTLHYEVKFSVELANEHREFISGKKNGKINRIMKATGAKIKFDPCNEYNFYVDLSSAIAVKAVEALSLLQEELPAEISFYVPETYHKRIIGVGGKNIQRIMKKYGVYVKFSNSEEFANLGGYFDNLDNVVARTPSKNAMNLENLKHAVMELVNPKDKDFVQHSISIPKQYHILLLSGHASELAELHEVTNATVRFPEKETGSDTVKISGPECYIQQAMSMLLSLVDEQYVYPVPFSEAMDRIISKPEFKVEVLDKIKSEWNMTLIPPHAKDLTGNATNSEESKPSSSAASRRPSASSTLSAKDNDEEAETNGSGELARSLSSLTDSDDEDNDNEEEDHVFVFKYSRNNEDHLQSAKELLVQYLINNQIEVYDDEIKIQRPRSDSFAEAFPHFNSKILSSVAGGSELPVPAPTFSNYSLFQTSGNAFEPLGRSPSSGVGSNPGALGAGSMGVNDIRALFSHGLPPLASSPPRWSDGSKQQASIPGGVNVSASASGNSYSPVQSSGPSQHNSQSPSFNRLTSLPIDPWGSPMQQQQNIPTTPGFPGTIGQYRTPPPGIGNTSGGGYYSPGQQMFSPEGPYGGTLGFQTPVSASSNHLYSGNNSPVQGSSNNIGGYTNAIGSQSPRQQHQPSPQRPVSGSFISRDNLQFLEDKVSSGPSFGAGYGPSLNSGSGRSQQQLYQQSSLNQSIQFPQQRQRHSSHNSTASHHTMFLGPIGGGLGSAAGSVNSDDISTEDESDEPFDEMRNRYRSYPYKNQGFQTPTGNFGSQTPPSSVLANRRGSVPSMGSMYSNQQLYQSSSPHHSNSPLPNVVRLSNSSSDLYGRKSLVNAMARHSIGQQPDNSYSPSRAPGGGLNTNSNIGSNMPNLSSGSVFSNERDLFSSGLGGIIGGGTISHSNSGGFYNTLNTHTNNPIHKTSGGSGALSPSALPFLADTSLDRSSQHMVSGGWDR